MQLQLYLALFIATIQLPLRCALPSLSLLFLLSPSLSLSLHLSLPLNMSLCCCCTSFLARNPHETLNEATLLFFSYSSFFFIAHFPRIFYTVQQLFTFYVYTILQAQSTKVFIHILLLFVVPQFISFFTAFVLILFRIFSYFVFLFFPLMRFASQ